MVGDATRLAIPSAAPTFLVTTRCDDKQIRSASIAWLCRNFIPPSSRDIHDQGDARWIQTRSVVVALADGGPICVERAAGCQVFQRGHDSRRSDASSLHHHRARAALDHGLPDSIHDPIGVVIANEWGGSAQDSLYDLHRSIGAAVIPLVFLRLIYRWAHLPLPLPEDIPAMQRLTAHVQEITCPDLFVSISNSTLPLRRLFQQHRSHFRREVGKTASPREQTYPAVIGSSGKCHSTKSLRDSPLRGGVTGRTVIVDRTSSLFAPKLGPLFYRSSGGA